MKKLLYLVFASLMMLGFSSCDDQITASGIYNIGFEQVVPADSSGALAFDYLTGVKNINLRDSMAANDLDDLNISELYADRTTLTINAPSTTTFNNCERVSVSIFLPNSNQTVLMVDNFLVPANAGRTIIIPFVRNVDLMNLIDEGSYQIRLQMQMRNPVVEELNVTGSVRIRVSASL